jgi:hypothetical protein
VNEILVSFDIDGTLEVGDPPGPIPLSVVADARARGYIVGSASDRTVGEQRAMWSAAGIEVDFIGHKHHLTANTERFGCTRLIHIGDTEADRYYAELAGFEFHWVTELPAPETPGWIF